MENAILSAINIGRTVNPNTWSPADVVSKLFEEGGELSQAIQIKRGMLPTKTQEDGEEIRECADVILCAIDAVSQVNRDLTPEELLSKITEAVILKQQKWQRAIDKATEVAQQKA